MVEVIEKYLHQIQNNKFYNDSHKLKEFFFLCANLFLHLKLFLGTKSSKAFCSSQVTDFLKENEG